MLGLVIIVAAVALALFVLVRTFNRLTALRRRAEADEEAAAEYNAALRRFPASVIGGPLGFRPR